MATLKQQMAADAAAICLNQNEFADEATYNDVPILVVAELGPDAQAGNTFASDAQADRATFWVSAADVPEPEEGDVIVHEDREWRVARVLESGGGMHKLECLANEAVGWR